MKKTFYTLLLGLLPWTLTAQTVILDHESPTTSTVFTYFGNCTLDGANTSILPNPDASGINTSANVGAFVKTDCAATFAGGFANPATALPVDLTTDNRVRLKVWMENAGSVSLKLENSTTGGANWIGTQAVSDANQWVEVEFDMTQASFEPPFTAAAGNSYATVVLFFDFGAPGTGVDETYFFDDLVTDFVFTLAQITLPISWDDPAVNYTTTDFGGNVSSLATDPLDPSNTVLSLNKPDTAEFFAGTTLSTNAGFATPLPITNEDTRVSARVFSPDAGIPVRLKVEDASDPTRSVETEVLTTVAGAWEVLIFDFADEAPGTAALNISFTFNKMSIFFNFPVDGPTAGDKTYLLDDVIFIGGGGTGIVLIDLPITFDEPGVDYTLTDFEGNSTVLAADPTDPSNTVAQTTKGPGAQFFAGTTMSTPAGFANPIPVTVEQSIMSIRVYSPDAGIRVRLKIEDATDPTRSVETDTFTTVANAWETLVFDFNNEVPGTAVLNPSFSFTKASVFFNFGVDGATAGEKTYLWDDVFFGLPDPGCSSASAPEGLSSNVDASGAALSWTPISGSIGCVIEGGIVGEPATRRRIVGSDVSSFFIPSSRLVAGETYNWRVSCGCSADPTDFTLFSAPALFSVPTARMSSLEVVNPVAQSLNITVNSQVEDLAVIRLSDLQGRSVGEWRVALSPGVQTVQFDVSNISNGMYLLHSAIAGQMASQLVLVQQ